MNIAEERIKSHIVCDKIKNMIKSRQIVPGARILSQRKFAKEMNVSVDVMRNAFKLLEKENLIFRRQGSGTFINPDIRTNSAKLAGIVTSYHREDISEYFEPLFVEASEREITPMICSIDLQSNWIGNIRNMVGHKPDFLLLDVMRVHKYDEVMPLIQDIPHLFVHHWSWVDYPPEPGIYVDYAESYVKALRYLLDLGHKDITIIAYDELTAKYRRNIFAQVERILGMKIGDRLHVLGLQEDENCAERIETYWNKYRPMAVFALSDFLLYRFIDKIRKIDPESVRAMDKIGFYDQHWSRQTGFEFSTMRVDFRNIWKSAFLMANENEYAVKTVVAELVLRK